MVCGCRLSNSPRSTGLSSGRREAHLHTRLRRTWLRPSFRTIRESRPAIKRLTCAWLGAVLVSSLVTSTIARAADQADFKGEHASAQAREVADWVVASRDNRHLPFVVVDKIAARIFVFNRYGVSLGAAPALLGLGIGDDSAPGIGKRKLAAIPPADRTTPAGRFQASLGEDFEQDILWVDYATALSLHRVIVGKPSERRLTRLDSPSPLDNRISFGCINVPARFYDEIVAPTFKGTVGVVYILPETKPLTAIFAIPRPLGQAVAGKVSSDERE
jgi:hypothetical protein